MKYYEVTIDAGKPSSDAILYRCQDFEIIRFGMTHPDYDVEIKPFRDEEVESRKVFSVEDKNTGMHNKWNTPIYDLEVKDS